MSPKSLPKLMWEIKKHICWKKAAVLGGLSIVVFALLWLSSFPVLASPPEPTPTVDRLAQPTLPAAPSQADLGAVDYWFTCMVCHGDRGQGLTEEWRAAAGPEDMNCWQSRCHAANHPPEGFELPLYAPRIIGEGSLGRFETAADLYQYIFTEMPWQAPGMLDEDAYWRLTAFLLRENEFISGQEELGADNAAQFVLHAKAPKPDFQTLSEEVAQPLAATTPAAETPPEPDQDQGLPFWVLLCGFGGILLLGSLSWPLIVARLRRGDVQDG